MDATTRQLVDFAMQAEFDTLPEGTVRECTRRLIDAFGCAMGAYDEPLSRAARAIAGRHPGVPGVTVWGSNLQAAPEAAAFANGVMLRYLDLSDTYVGKCRGHPSDVIAGILAVAESVHADGPAVINAMVLAYDVYCGLSDAVDFNSKGWDQPVYGVLAGALAAGKLLQLSAEQMANAVSLALAPWHWGRRGKGTYQTGRAARAQTRRATRSLPRSWRKRASVARRRCSRDAVDYGTWSAASKCRCQLEPACRTESSTHTSRACPSATTGNPPYLVRWSCGLV